MPKFDPCELFNLIPKEKIDQVFEESKTASAELDYAFLGFEDVYKAVTLFVPKSKVIIDLGCGYAFQSWYFRDYKRYIGVDIATKNEDVLKIENSKFYHMSIQEFVREMYFLTGLRKDEVFAVCSYVPDDEAQEIVRRFFPYCLVYYPTGTLEDMAQKMEWNIGRIKSECK